MDSVNGYQRASGFIGAAMAVQGITDATVILHGQTGCRKGLIASQSLMNRTERRDREFYGTENAIPFTNVTSQDYYTHTLDKLQSLVSHVDGENYALKVLMCAPGTSLIGDDLERVQTADNTMSLPIDAIPKYAPEGFDHAIFSILEHLSPESIEKDPMSVNLLGLSIMHKDWYSVCHEISHLLKDAGFRVRCVLGAGCSVGDILESTGSSYSIVLDPMYCAKTSELYEKKFGITTISIEECPIGFDAFRRLLNEIESVTGVRVAHGHSMLKKSMKRGYQGINASGISMKGRRFAIVADRSTYIPLKDFLVSSFGMVEDPKNPDYLFAPGDIARAEESSGNCRKGIDIGFPSTYGQDFLKKPLMGLEGTMYILDGLFN